MDEATITKIGLAAGVEEATEKLVGSFDRAVALERLLACTRSLDRLTDEVNELGEHAAGHPLIGTGNAKYQTELEQAIRDIDDLRVVFQAVLGVLTRQT